MKSTALIILCALLMSVVSTVNAQTPPAHPRLLFTQAQRAALQAKVQVPGSPAAQSLGAMSSSAYIQTSSPLPSASGQRSYVVYRSLRRMTEVAFRYQMTGNVAFANNAKSVMLDFTTKLIPTGDKAYLSSSYPCALALTFDLVYDQLNASEKQQVVAHLEAWVTAMKNGSNGWAAYSSYGAAVDNFSMAWCTGIAYTLMAILGDSNYPNINAEIHSNLQKLHDGWMDAISPDGSVDEHYGYVNYGNTYSLHAGLAGINCGFGDYIAGTNILKTPRWLGAALAGSTFLWTGDSSPSHKGNRMDPVIFYAVGRTGDTEALWGLNRVFAAEPPSDSTPSQAFSPHVNNAVFYPQELTPQRPVVLSQFFRDNLNQGWGPGNKTQAHADIGNGGHAFMHNSTAPGAASLCAYYLIRDEWMNHSHEDDGHFGVSSEGVWHYLDLGYAVQGSYEGGQTTDHNIVLTQGVAPFMGSNNNYYNPPTNARFLGEKKSVWLNASVDYVRGSHAFMWQMQEADRSVIMIKDDLAPYMILVDHVNRGPGDHTYEEVFHTAGPSSGQGTASQPLTTSAQGKTFSATWLSPSSVSIQQGISGVNAGTTYYSHKVVATGPEMTFVSVHGKNAPLTQTPLTSASFSTHGGEVSFGAIVDKIMVSNDGSGLQDAETQSDARFAWMRRENGLLQEWIAAEATSVSHQGLPLLASSLKVNVSVRGSRVEIQNESGQPAAGLSLSLFAPQTITEVLVDGESTNFNLIGQTLSIGGPVLPQLSLDDRAYTFTRGSLGDALVSPNAIVTPLGELSSSGLWASARLMNGQTFGTRPLSFSMDAAFQPSVTTLAAGVILESSYGAADILEAFIAPLTSTLHRVVVFRAGSYVGEASMVVDTAFQFSRLTLVMNPNTGTIEVQSHHGQALANFNVAAFGDPFEIRVATLPTARIDNITVFDSAEDGATPQGVAFHSTQDGYAGWIMRAPSLAMMQDFRAVSQNEFVAPSITWDWFALGGLHETIVNKFSPEGTPIPMSLQEAGWEFSVPAVHTMPGFSTGMWIKTANGQELLGLVNF